MKRHNKNILNECELKTAMGMGLSVIIPNTLNFLGR